MKNSKTTIRELNAKYRTILRKCFLLNALAIGLIAATSANAEVTIDTSGLTAGGDAVTGTATISGLGSMAEANTGDYYTRGQIDSAGYLTEHQSLADYSTTEQMNTAIGNATNGMATQTWVEGKGYLTEHQSLAAYSTTEQMNSAISSAITALDLENTYEAKGTAAALVNTLDANASYSANGLSLNIVEADGKITSISGSIAAETYDEYGAAAAAQTAAAADATAKANAAQGAAETYALNGDNAIWAVIGDTDVFDELTGSDPGEGTIADAIIAGNEATFQAVLDSANADIPGAAPELGDYAFLDAEGNETNLQANSELETPLSADSYTSTSAAAGEDYAGKVAANEETLSYAEYVDEETDARSAGDYTYAAKDANGNDISIAGNTVQDVLEKDLTVSTLAGGGSVTGNSSGTASIDIDAYTVTKNDKEYSIEADESGYILKENGVAVADPSAVPGLSDILEGLKNAYESDVEALATLQETLAGYYAVGVGNKALVGDVVAADNATITTLAQREASLEDAQTEYAGDLADHESDVAGYDGSLAQIIDNRADARIDAVIGHAADDSDPDAPVEATGLYADLEAEAQARADGDDAIMTIIGDTEAIASLSEEGNVSGALSGLQGAIGDMNALNVPTGTTDEEEPTTTYAATLVEAANANANAISELQSTIGSANTAAPGEESNATGLYATIEAGDQATLIAAKDYTDEVVGTASTDTQAATGLHAVIEAGDAATLNAANEYADDVASTAETNAKNYAKDYTDALANGQVAANTTNIAKIVNGDTVVGKAAKDGAGNVITETYATKTALSDEATARIAGDAQTLADAKAYADSGDNHILNDVIGDTSQLTGGYFTPVAQAGDPEAVQAADGNTTLVDSLNTMSTNIANQAEANQAANNANFARVESKINKLETKMEKGLAANNALAGLVPLDHDHKTQISAALGGYKYNQALAVGAFHYLNDRTLLNAGIAYGGNDSMSYKVGVTFGF